MKSSQKRDGCAEATITFLIAVALLFPEALWRGWVITKLWGWFLLPHFGLEVPGVMQAAGLSLALRFIINQRRPPAVEPTLDDELPKWAQELVLAITFPAFTLLAGWLIHLCT